MMRRIQISAGNLTVLAGLNESPTADAIWEGLPLSAIGARWGKEIYFSVQVKAADPRKSEVVDKGDLGYWEPGSAFCIFWGPTPASNGQEIRPASAVSVFGHILGDAEVFDTVHSGSRITVQKAGS